MVLKTREKRVLSLAGPIIAHETLLRCVNCATIQRSADLAALVPTHCTIAYDVLVWVGQAIFLKHQTAAETAAQLARRNLHLSLSEIDYLAKKFILYLAIAHRRAIPRIQQVMIQNGGYILHLDGTCDQQSPMLMTGLDSITEIILGNVKLASEKADRIIPFLIRLKDAFGTPVAVVHDMGMGILRAVADVFPGVPDFICHFHFLRDLGNDFFGEAYDTIRKRLQKHAVSSALRALVRDLREPLTAAETTSQTLAQAIDRSIATDHPELLAAACAYGLAQWALEGKNVGDGYGFPFDRSHLAFAERILQLHEQLPEFKDILLRDSWRDNLPLHKLFRALEPTAGDYTLRNAVQELRWRCDLFDQLRKAMRIAPKGAAQDVKTQTLNQPIHTIRNRVLAFRQRLDGNRRYAADPGCRKMAAQIDKYREKLFADPIRVGTPNGSMLIQPQRTNNILEQFFRRIKRDYRRRTGTTTMERTIKAMLEQTPLVKNLENPRYLAILLNGKKSLEELFADIDAREVRVEMRAQTSPDRTLPGFNKLISLPDLPALIIKLFIQSQHPKSNQILGS